MNRGQINKSLLIVGPLILVAIPVPLLEDGGGLDGYGCHHNRKHGGYHCHRGAFRSAMFDSKAEMLQQLEQPSRSPATEKEPAPAVVGQFSGKVVGVADGDTITVLHSGKGERIRLHGIDCPEKRQAFGNRAKQFASALVFGKTVTVSVLDVDHYGRTVGEVILPDGRVLNHELVKGGLAWWYRRYAPDDGTLAQLEADAKAAKRGLWADPDPVPPWEWRRR